jgi:predicted RNase H-like HicB family nuclease
MQYAIIIEKGERNYSAYFPDLPGCIATGETLEEVKQRMREALELHLRGMRDDGLPIPEPSLVELSTLLSSFITSDQNFS